MKITSINTNLSSFSKLKKESFGRIKRKYQRPINTIGYWEVLSLSK